MRQGSRDRDLLAFDVTPDDHGSGENPRAVVEASVAQEREVDLRAAGIGCGETTSVSEVQTLPYRRPRRFFRRTRLNRVLSAEGRSMDHRCKRGLPYVQHGLSVQWAIPPTASRSRPPRASGVCCMVKLQREKRALLVRAAPEACHLFVPGAGMALVNPDAHIMAARQ
jgi:hypothetical protein